MNLFERDHLIINLHRPELVPGICAADAPSRQAMSKDNGDGRKGARCLFDPSPRVNWRCDRLYAQAFPKRRHLFNHGRYSRSLIGKILITGKLAITTTGKSVMPTIPQRKHRTLRTGIDPRYVAPKWTDEDKPQQASVDTDHPALIPAKQ